MTINLNGYKLSLIIEGFISNYIIMNIFLGLVICVPIILLAKLKTDLNIANRKLDYWRQQTLYLNKRFIRNEELPVYTNWVQLLRLANAKKRRSK